MTDESCSILLEGEQEFPAEKTRWKELENPLEINNLEK